MDADLKYIELTDMIRDLDREMRICGVHGLEHYVNEYRHGDLLRGILHPDAEDDD